MANQAAARAWPVIGLTVWVAVIAAQSPRSTEGGVTSPAALPPLTTAAEVAAAVAPPDGEPARVRLEAVVSYQDAYGTTFLVDETGVTDAFPGREIPPLAAGDVVLMEGVVQNGGFMGAVRPSRVERLRAGPPPEPLPLTFPQLASGLHVFRRAAISGIVRRSEPAGEDLTRLLLAEAGAEATVILEQRLDPGRQLVGARVRAVGLAAGEANDRREVVTPWLRVRSRADLEVLEPAEPPFAGPPLPYTQLAVARADGRRVLVRGTAVAGRLGGGLFLRAEHQALFVRPLPDDPVAARVAAGDVVEAAGFAEPGVFRLFLADAVCRVVGREDAPRARAPTASALRSHDASHEADLVEVEGHVVQRLDRGDRTELLVDVGGLPVTVVSEPQVAAAVPIGSAVRVTGPVQATALETTNYRTGPSSFLLWLASPDDLVVLRQPPWWTTRRIGLAVAAAAAGLAAATAVAAGWIILLRGRVKKQLALIEGSLKAEAVADERARIAGEFHDSLEQGLAALSLRLGMAASRLPAGDAREVLEHQRRLLGWLQAETREFLWDLRDPVQPDSGLGETLAAQIEQLVSITTVPVELVLPAQTLLLPPETQHQVVRIVREAVHNAVRHAAAARIEVRVDSGPGGTRVEIRDDGQGFDVASRGRVRGQYGLRGMEERAARIGGRLAVESRPGQGTVVRLFLPVQATASRADHGHPGDEPARLPADKGIST